MLLLIIEDFMICVIEVLHIVVKNMFLKLNYYQ